MVANAILKVLYAPQKAFKEIIQNPRYLGTFILVIIFVVAQIGTSYIVASRSYVEQTMPVGDQGDVWTANAALWQANPGVTVSNNTADYINSTYYGTTSIEFTASNASDVWMETNWNEPVNCGADGFKSVSLRVKIVAPDVKPENVSLYLCSLSASNFYYDLTSAFSNSVVNVWNNITVPVGSASWASSSNAASWGNITGLKMEFTWSSNSSIDLRVDGLFFRGIFKDPIELYGSSVFISAALNAVTLFLFQWLLFTGLMYVIIKGLKGNVTWKPLMVAVGFALAAVVVQALIILAIYATSLPNLNYPLEVVAGIPGEFDVAYQVILDSIATVTLVGSIIQAVVYVWVIALGAIITRAITEFGWLKSILVSGASYLLMLLILGFLGI